MTTFKLTCFSDEISSVLEEQLDLLEQKGINHLEIRSIWSKNILELSTEELQQLHQIIEARGFSVSSIASPIGKYPITSPFVPQLEALNRAIRAAHILKTPYIRIFSYYIPENEAKEKYREEVLQRMAQLAHVAAQSKLTLILENDSGMYGSTHEGGLEIMEHCQSPFLKFAFDPGNYVIEGIDPMLQAFPKVASDIEYIHIKDATSSPRQFVPAGEGEGGLEALLIEMQKRRFTGFLSVEAHLHHYLPNESDTGRVLTAIHALTALLEKHNIEWR
ncbi:sugar phosphate isomerase/epimerase family protein [Bacillus sp. FJAT-28004]|uniref:sugar phosphate isomerase/epimerase family protein n=1 Tax=Bacillus sp. FJAT-28004 TaxID=1679165 RepID=UPI0006B59264|nr:sugar phosphate isomerase/epimerase family protein [Bacillus sp. FJAT-28004]